MARPKKADENKPIAPAMQQQPQVPQQPFQQQPQQQPMNGGSAAPMAMAPPAPASSSFSNNQGRVIDVANFITVRDSVYQRLNSIQHMLVMLANEYLTQTNHVLGEPSFGDAGELPLNQDFAPLQMHAGSIPTAFPVPVPEEKKERKKRQHDPNAPKRPLTPYFLYMQTARPIIAADLGEGVPKGAVQEEGQRRWASMSVDEKLGWNQAYQYNLRLYNARVHSYKAGNLVAKEMSDDEAVRYCEEFNIPMPHVGGVESEAANDGSVAPQQLLAPAPAALVQPEPAAKPAAKPKASRKRKSEAIEPAQAAPPVAAPATATPDKKPRKRASQKPEDPHHYDQAIDPALFQLEP
ncbi:unnamed protein product [Discula destructiva]